MVKSFVHVASILHQANFCFAAEDATVILTDMVGLALLWIAMLLSAFLGGWWVVRRLRRSRANRYDVGAVSDDWLIQQRRDR